MKPRWCDNFSIKTVVCQKVTGKKENELQRACFQPWQVFKSITYDLFYIPLDTVRKLNVHHFVKSMSCVQGDKTEGKNFIHWN